LITVCFIGGVLYLLMGRYILFLYRMGRMRRRTDEERKENEGERIVCNYCVFALFAETGRSRSKRN
jgi:hypothetical protein